MKPRTAELVLVTSDGRPIGSLPAVPVATPWWQDVEPVVRAARDVHGVAVIVLRMLDAELDQPHGGRVTYLAEVAEPIRAERWTGVLDDQPRRHAFARPGGPAADLAWARALLAKRGLRPTAPPTQVRTWNLSSLWRVPVEGQTAWLKVVPHFFAHEGALLAVMAGARVPAVLGHEGGRMLLAEIAGEDLYEADLPLLQEMVNLLVELQRSWEGRVEELLALGLPDWRAPALGAAIAEVVERTREEIAAEDRITLADFVQGLPGRFDEVAGCGLKDSLVHGDFHPGNFRGDGRGLTLLDWADSGVGHPLLDQPAFFDAISPAAVAAVRMHWLQQWREAVPGSDPARASVLLAPIAAARQAVIYRRFLDNIEPSEQPYHRADPAKWLTRTAALVKKGNETGL
jgi:Ser/Thr protein kinase RdoA (MazF antagonist)